MRIFTLIFTILLLSNSNALASRVVEEVNYFASLRSNETNVRAGPGQNYPVKFTYQLRSIPVRVISEYDNWNEIEDYEGQSGWVTQSLLTKKRTLMVRTTNQAIKMHSKDSEKSRVVYNLENNVIGDYIKCTNNWCAIKVNNKKGWVSKAYLWGANRGSDDVGEDRQ